MRLGRVQLLAVVMLLGFCLFSGLRTFQQAITTNPNRLVSSHVPDYERRAQGLRPFLPPRGYVGYLGDAQSGASVYFRDYYGLQYALAPLMFLIVGDAPADIPYTLSRDLAQRQPPELIIANFRDRQALEAQIRALNLELVGRADETLVVLRRRPVAQTLLPAQERTP